MSKFNATHCRAGHKVICSLIDSSDHRRATGEEIAALLNTELKIDSESREAWTVDDVKCAVYEGAFDSKTRHFSYFRGRYGGYREYDAEVLATVQAEEAEKERAKEEKARKRRTKAEAQAPVTEAPVMDETLVIPEAVSITDMVPVEVQSVESVVTC